MSATVRAFLLAAVTALLMVAPAGSASAQAPVGGEVPVAAEGELPRIAWAGDRYIVVWVHESFEEDLDLIFKREFSADGTPLGDDQLVSSLNDGRRTVPDVAAAPDGRHVIVWQDDVEETSPSDPDSDDDIMMRRYDSQGLAGPIEQVSFAPGEMLTVYEETTPAVALTPSGSPVVAWWEATATDDQVVVRNLAPEGAPHADLALATTGFDEVELATQPDGRFVLAYPDASGAWDMRRFTAGGAPLTGAVDLAGAADTPRLGTDAAGTVVVTDGLALPGQEALWRRFTPELTLLGTAFPAPTFAAVDLSSVGVAPDGRFAVASSRSIPPGDNDIGVRGFAPDGSPLTPELIASESTEFEQLDPDVAVQPNGSLAVVWFTGGPGDELRARFYSTSGSATPPSTDPPAAAPLPPVAVKKKCPKGKKLKKGKCVKKKKKK